MKSSWPSVLSSVIRALYPAVCILKRRAAALGFALSVVFIAFIGGLAIGSYGFFPMPQVREARATAKVLRNQIFDTRPNTDEGFLGFSDVPRRDLAARRIQVQPGSGPAPQSDSFIVSGGKYQYYEYCPEHGCLALQFDRNGKMRHAWPFRPDEFDRTPLAALPYEAPLFDAAKNIYAADLQSLPDGDLIAIFSATNSFPSGAGIARIAPDGRFKWFRRDYSHHWPVITGNDELLVPGQRIRKNPITLVIAGEPVAVLACDTAYPGDTIRVFGMDGRLKREIPVLDAILQSPYRSVLIHTINKCDPLHVNYITPVGPEIAARLPGVAADDFLVSMRFISAIAILSHRTGAVLRLFRGNFVMQHSVQPYRGSQVILFDNRGVGPSGGPSRVLLYDLATGAEKTVFPSAGRRTTPFFTNFAGNIALSADRERMLVAVTGAGLGYEVRISDGAILTKFDNLSDLDRFANFTAEKSKFAGRFTTFGIYYGH